MSRERLGELIGRAAETVENIETGKRANRFPRSQRATVLGLARVLGMDPDDALAMLGYDAMTAADRAAFGRDVHMETVTESWPQMTRRQRQFVAGLVQTFTDPADQHAQDRGDAQDAYYGGQRRLRSAPAVPEEPVEEATEQPDHGD